ncbi:hypothetical protein [Flavobacterium terrae]|uniref:Uncharacterized protein n=1 Tax=Flavobacterium terrae TaxID=415425 RepID=A0A1M6GX46_9FLAO|nr:hypothetical protein [Flavobacterium terrae]SHJ14516.1 hypothetical protein SAMN05444363_2778 [Flavobacterium terrae]
MDLITKKPKTMPYTMLKNFDFRKDTGNQVTSKFQIPTNCEQKTFCDNGEATITITLKDGEKAPANTFQDIEETLTSNGSDILKVTFEQVETTTIRKPRVDIVF